MTNRRQVICRPEVTFSKGLHRARWTPVKRSNAQENNAPDPKPQRLSTTAMFADTLSKGFWLLVSQQSSAATVNLTSLWLTSIFSFVSCLLAACKAVANSRGKSTLHWSCWSPREFFDDDDFCLAVFLRTFELKANSTSSPSNVSLVFVSFLLVACIPCYEQSNKILPSTRCFTFRAWVSRGILYARRRQNSQIGRPLPKVVNIRCLVVCIRFNVAAFQSVSSFNTEPGPRFQSAMMHHRERRARLKTLGAPGRAQRFTPCRRLQ